MKTFIGKPCTDHLGNKYKSQEEMCKHYNIKPCTYLRRIERGATKEEALTKKINQYKKPYIVKGVEYQSKSEMLEAYNINNCTYDRRIKEGKSVEQALSCERQRYTTRYQIADPWGMIHESERKMCDYYGVEYNTYRARKYKGHTLEECLSHEHLYPKQQR